MLRVDHLAFLNRRHLHLLRRRKNVRIDLLSISDILDAISAGSGDISARTARTTLPLLTMKFRSDRLLHVLLSVHCRNVFLKGSGVKLTLQRVRSSQTPPRIVRLLPVRRIVSVLHSICHLLMKTLSGLPILAQLNT